MRMLRGLNANPGKMNGVDAGCREFVQLGLRHIRTDIAHIRVNERHGLLALWVGHSAKRQTDWLSTRVLTPNE
jgi:hypothetical protein